MTNKYVSYSLFGDSKKYINGIKRNADLIDKYYPDWEMIIYVNKEGLENFLSLDYKEQFNIIIASTGNTNAVGTMWRFFVHDLADCERFIIRDLDSRISQREVDAVNAWIESGHKLHIMRDHPHHGHVIMGGMWGMVPDRSFNMRQACEDYITAHGNTTKWSMTDMDFLRDVVYSKYFRYSKIHATYAKFEPWAEDFPSELIDRKFVGEIYDENEQRGPQYDYI